MLLIFLPHFIDQCKQAQLTSIITDDNVTINQGTEEDLEEPTRSSAHLDQPSFSCETSPDGQITGGPLASVAGLVCDGNELSLKHCRYRHYSDEGTCCTSCRFATVECTQGELVSLLCVCVCGCVYMCVCVYARV